MAQGTATPRPNSVKPVTRLSDSGITLGRYQVQAGRGGTSRSQANNTSTGDTGNDATVVFAAVDPKAEQRGLYLNNTLKAIEARSLLVEELFKGPDRNVETIKQQLQTLVVENRRVYGSKTPNALVLNMGFKATLNKV